MDVDSSQIMALVNNPISWILAAYVAKDVWKWAKRQGKTQDEALIALNLKLEGALKENSQEMAKLTIAIVRLETRLEDLTKQSQEIPKMKRDIDVLFERGRIMAGIKDLTNA